MCSLIPFLLKKKRMLTGSHGCTDNTSSSSKIQVRQKTNIIKKQFHQKQFHQNPISSKTIFIMNWFFSTRASLFGPGQIRIISIVIKICQLWYNRTSISLRFILSFPCFSVVFHCFPSLFFSFCFCSVLLFFSSFFFLILLLFFFSLFLFSSFFLPALPRTALPRTAGQNFAFFHSPATFFIISDPNEEVVRLRAQVAELQYGAEFDRAADELRFTPVFSATASNPRGPRSWSLHVAPRTH